MIRTNLLKYIFTILLGWMAFCGALAQKVILVGEDSAHTVPLFRESFDLLAKNRVVYNAYNDSIFLIRDHGQWVNFFRRRALKNHQLFASNKVLLDNIFGYFKRDTTYTGAYQELLKTYFHNYRGKAAADPFLTLEVCKLLDKFYQTCPDSLNLSNLVNLWLGETNLQIYNLGKDVDKLRESYLYYKKVNGFCQQKIRIII